MEATLMIREYMPSEMDQIINISDHCFGKGYYTRNQLKGLGKSAHKIWIAGSSPDRVMGFAICSILSDIELAKKLGPDRIQPILKGQKAGVLQTVAIGHEYRGMGIGRSLAVRVLEYIEGQGVPDVFSFLWYNKQNPPNAMGLMKALFFEEFGEIEAFWYQDSLVRQYHCLTCGPPPCRCSARVFYKKV
jgi:ribosomal protein S18 acetylase RimI-like enzyme